MNQTTTTSTSQGSPELVMCILSYLGIFALIPYFARKDDEFIRWHARQGLLLAATLIVLCVVLGVLSMLPVIGLVASLVSGLIGLATLGLSVYCIIQACNGRRWEIPVLGTLVR